MSRHATSAYLALYLLCATSSFAIGDEINNTQDSEDLQTRPTLLDHPGGPKEQLRALGITTDFWVTQFYQGQTAGDATKAWFYGGKTNLFVKIDPEKLGLWPGFHVNMQYEHYIGEDINRKDFALLPVNTAQAYLAGDTYPSALSLNVAQDFGEHISVSAGKYNMMTLASRTPLIGGGGIDTFMNRAFALPSTGVAYTAARGATGDRVVISAPYTLGAAVTFKTKPFNLTLAILDPRSAQDPAVIEHPFAKGRAWGASLTVPTEFFGLLGYQTVRAAYSDAFGIDLDSIANLRPPLTPASSVGLKQGYWFTSYAVQQNLFQSKDNPAVGWGLFTLATLSDGNPNPVRWSAFAGLGGNNLMDGRENDRWGVGFFKYGFSDHLLDGLDALGFQRRDESGVEAFYNYTITPWLRLSADLQVIEPWNPAKAQATYAALRLQTKF